jgi:exopolysaccharide production protein ExoY
MIAHFQTNVLAPTAPMRAPARAVGMPIKRIIDLVIAVTATLALAPLLILVFVAIKFTSRGPAVFWHRRVGFNGEHFSICKFRTMRTNPDDLLREFLVKNPAAAAEWAASRTLTHDPRLTAVGAILRKLSFDELPQLLNVITGEMSLVGPRPVTVEDLKRYGSNASAYLSCKPGITGLWQISGRESTTFANRIACDSFYAFNWSPWLDFKIIAWTVPALLQDTSARAKTHNAANTMESPGKALRRLNWRIATVSFFIGLMLATAGIGSCLFGLVQASYPFELSGTAALAVGCLTATFALAGGERLRNRIGLNGT